MKPHMWPGWNWTGGGFVNLPHVPNGDKPGASYLSFKPDLTFPAGSVRFRHYGIRSIAHP